MYNPYSDKLAVTIPILSQILKEHGYVTSFYALNAEHSLTHEAGFDRGFDYYDYSNPFLDSPMSMI